MSIEALAEQAIPKFFVKYDLPNQRIEIVIRHGTRTYSWHSYLDWPHMAEALQKKHGNEISADDLAFDKLFQEGVVTLLRKYVEGIETAKEYPTMSSIIRKAILGDER